MRLLDTQTLELCQFSSVVPRYAILSHRWGDDEVTFQDMQSVCDEHVSSKVGFKKVKDFCQVALSQGYRYGWVDTCCINKADPTELSEAINSMFQWYRNSGICIVYLGDVSSTEPPEVYNHEFERSQWFRRGWTLQELLAPALVSFYSSGWNLISTKTSCLEALSDITGIAKSALEGDSLESFCIAQRMSWASLRETTRPEDMAYCLLGIFDVNMPLLYGEGRKAFARLQQEIMKTSDDQTILTWKPEWIPRNELHSQPWNSAFAPAPFCFVSYIERFDVASQVNHFSYVRKPFAVTNLGISITLPIVRVDNSTFYAVLDCHVKDKPVCIPLRHIGEDERQYQKVTGPMLWIDELEGSLCEVRDIYIQGSTSHKEPLDQMPASFKKGRWSTNSLERSRVMNYLEVSESSRESTMSKHASAGGEIVMMFAWFFLFALVYLVCTWMNWGDPSPLFGLAAAFNSFTSKGALAFHVQLFVFGGLSAAGVHLETMLTEIRDFWILDTNRGVSENIPTSWFYASPVERYDVHDPKELLQHVWMQDLWGWLLIPGGLLFVCKGIYFNRAYNWKIAAPVECVNFILGTFWMFGMVRDAVRQQKWLKVGRYLVMICVLALVSIWNIISLQR